MLEQLLLISAALVGGGNGTVELTVSDAMERIDSCVLEYTKAQGLSDGLVTNCVPIVREDSVVGFEMMVNGNSIAFDLNGYALSPCERPFYYSSGQAEMITLDDLISLNNFAPSSCVCQIPSLVSQFSSMTFGNWTPVSFDAGTDDCAQIACMDLIYSCRLSNCGNPSSYTTSQNLYSALQEEQNYQSGLGITLSDFLPGFNAVLSTPFYADESTYNATKPVICAYASTNGGPGHFAMKIGEAETTVFWVIKTQWDIVVSETINFIGNEPLMINSQNEDCFFGIQAYRRQATFALFSS